MYKCGIFDSNYRENIPKNIETIGGIKMVEKSWTVIKAAQKYPHITNLLYQYNISSSC